jgi:putative ABC transport system permease protein
LNYIKNKDRGFEKEQKLVFSFYTTDVTGKIPSFINDIKQLAEVKAVSRVDNSPGQPVLYDSHLFLAGGNIATAPDASLIYADENFLKATGIKLMNGRDFRAFDSGKIIINEALAKTLGLQPDNAEGTKLFSQYGDGTPVTYEMAGVMKDYNYSSLREDVKPLFLIYSPDAGSEIIVNTNTANYKNLLGKIEAIWHNDFPAVPFEYAFVDDEVQKQYEAEITLSNTGYLQRGIYGTADK